MQGQIDESHLPDMSINMTVKDYLETRQYLTYELLLRAKIDRMSSPEMTPE